MAGARSTLATKPVRKSKRRLTSSKDVASAISSRTRTPHTSTSRSDMLLAINDPYMQQIVDGTKNYEFRKYDMPGVQRIWFYCTAPHSAITHVCEVAEAATRSEGDSPLPENGEGNREYNARHPDWDGYDYAYHIRSVYEISDPITWAKMRDVHKMKIAPRGRMTLPESIRTAVKLEKQTKVR